MPKKPEVKTELTTQQRASLEQALGVIDMEALKVEAAQARLEAARAKATAMLYHALAQLGLQPDDFQLQRDPNGVLELQRKSDADTT